MKKIFFSIFILLFSLDLAYSQGLTIIDQNYESAINESKKQNKLLLIDFYFTGCLPCKKLDNQVFKNQTVSNEIGKSFILLKYNVENPTKERLELKHYITAYPTTLVLNQDQFVFHKLSGVDGNNVAESFRNFLAEAILKTSKNEYIKGVSNSVDLAYPNFLEKYKFGDENKLDIVEAKQYWETTNNHFSEVSFAMLYLFWNDLPDEIASFFLANTRKYEELYSREDVLFLKDRIIKGSFWKAITALDKAKFDLAVKWTKENYDEAQAEKTISKFKVIMLDQERRNKQKSAKPNRQKKSK